MVESSRGMNPAAAGRIGKVAPPKLAPPDAFGKSRAPGPGRSLGDRIVGPARGGGAGIRRAWVSESRGRRRPRRSRWLGQRTGGGFAVAMSWPLTNRGPRPACAGGRWGGAGTMSGLSVSPLQLNTL